MLAGHLCSLEQLGGSIHWACAYVNADVVSEKGLTAEPQFQGSGIERMCNRKLCLRFWQKVVDIYGSLQTDKPVEREQFNLTISEYTGGLCL